MTQKFVYHHLFLLLERESCVGEMAVIGGCVFGVMSLVIVSLVTVLLTLICKR